MSNAVKCKDGGEMKWLVVSLIRRNDIRQGKVDLNAFRSFRGLRLPVKRWFGGFLLVFVIFLLYCTYVLWLYCLSALSEVKVLTIILATKFIAIMHIIMIIARPVILSYLALYRPLKIYTYLRTYICICIYVYIHLCM